MENLGFPASKKTRLDVLGWLELMTLYTDSISLYT